MAGKESTLSIVLRTVDKATAGINAVNKRIDEVTKPTRDLGEALGKFGEKSGFNRIAEGFSSVGEKVKEVGFKILEAGAIVGEVTHLVLEMTEQFATLGHTSEKLGTTADFLASMRYAAQKAGVPIEALDAGLTTFVQNIGQARADTGRMVKFLSVRSPALLEQLKATKSNEAAFRLLADAMSKVTDPAKRLALAQKTVGDSALAPMLAQGSKGLLEQQGAYAALAGSQDDAVAGGLKVEDAMVDLKAATDGIKAALVTGLAPALAEIVDKLQEWFVEHRSDVKQWAADIGKKLPDAVARVTEVIKGAVSTVAAIVDGIGGIRVAALVLVGVIVGPLISSIVSLGIAILSTPVGWIMAAIAAIAYGVYEIIKHWDGIKEFFVDLWNGIRAKFSKVADELAVVLGPVFAIPAGIIGHWEGIKDFFVELWDDIGDVFKRAWDLIGGIMDKVSGAVDTVTGAIGKAIDFINPFSSSGTGASVAPVHAAIGGMIGPGAIQQAATIKVQFENAPRGLKVDTKPQGGMLIDTSTGYQFGYGS